MAQQPATWPPGSALKTSPAYNPFLPWRDPSGRWRSPRFGLRRQALLCRLTRTHGVESLLPWSPKRADVRAERREKGLRVRGTGVGAAVKGHSHERQLANKLEKRRKAMLGMPALIREWQIVSFDLETGEIANEWIERTWAEVEEVAQEIAALIEILLTNYIITIYPEILGRPAVKQAVTTLAPAPAPMAQRACGSEVGLTAPRGVRAKNPLAPSAIPSGEDRISDLVDEDKNFRN